MIEYEATPITALDVLRQIAAGKRRTREQRLASAFVKFWDALPPQHHQSMPARQMFLHIKSKGLYERICQARRHSGFSRGEWVVYRSMSTGAFWIRPAHEFYDGRFQPMNCQPQQEQTT